MNIFHLHTDPKICAEYHCDKHVVKMILETAQMLSTAYRKEFIFSSTESAGELYKPAFPKHPMTIWVGDSLGNYLWSLDLLGHLLNQYRHRYNNKVHSTGRILNNLLKLTDNVRDKFQYKTFLIPPLCMPDEYKCDNYIQAYRNYYIGEKKRFAKYTLVDIPEFML